MTRCPGAVSNFRSAVRIRAGSRAVCPCWGPGDHHGGCVSWVVKIFRAAACVLDVLCVVWTHQRDKVKYTAQPAAGDERRVFRWPCMQWSWILLLRCAQLDTIRRFDAARPHVRGLGTILKPHKQGRVDVEKWRGVPEHMHILPPEADPGCRLPASAGMQTG